MKSETIKSIRDADNGVIQEAKTLLIQRISNLLSTYFDGTLKFPQKARIRLDKLDYDLDIVTPMYFRPSALTISSKQTDNRLLNAEVCLSYVECEFDSFESMRHPNRWCDDLRDLSLSDVQNVLFKVEESIANLPE